MEETEAIKAKKRRRIVQLLNYLEIGAMAITAGCFIYIIGKSTGYSEGIKRGYDFGVVAGQHDVLTKYVQDRVWKVS